MAEHPKGTEPKVAQTPLMNCVLQNNADLVKKHISHAGQVDPVNHMTALQIAAANGKARAAEALITLPSQIASGGRIASELGMQTGPYARTALMHAAISNQGMCIRALSPEMGMTDSLGNTALVLAVKCNSYTFVRDFCDNVKEGYLERAAAYRELGAYSSHMTALMHAASLGHIEVMQLLIPFEACMQSDDDNKVTALMVATLAMIHYMECYGGADTFNKIDLAELLRAHPDDYPMLLPNYPPYKNPIPDIDHVLFDAKATLLSKFAVQPDGLPPRPFSALPTGRGREATRSRIEAEDSGVLENPECTLSFIAVDADTMSSPPASQGKTTVIAPPSTALVVDGPNLPARPLEMMNKGPSPEHKAKHPLCQVMNYVTCIRYLVLKEAGILGGHPVLSCALYCAVAANNLLAVRLLSSFETQITNSRRETSLILAARLNYSLVVREVLIRELGQRDANGFTALMYAAIQGNLDVVYTIVSSSEMCVQTPKGHSALMLAILSPLARRYYLPADEEAAAKTDKKHGNLDVVKLLSSPYLNREHKARYHRRLSLTGELGADGTGDLLDRLQRQAPGGEGGLFSASGATALMYAVACDQTDCVSVLAEVEYGLQARGELHDLFAAIEYDGDTSFVDELLYRNTTNPFITPGDVWIFRYTSVGDIGANNEMADKKLTMKAFRAKLAKEAAQQAKTNLRLVSNTLKEQHKAMTKELNEQANQALKEAQKLFSPDDSSPGRSTSKKHKRSPSTFSVQRIGHSKTKSSSFLSPELETLTPGLDPQSGNKSCTSLLVARSMSGLYLDLPPESSHPNPDGAEVASSAMEGLELIKAELMTIKEEFTGAFNNPMNGITPDDKNRLKHILSTCLAHVTAMYKHAADGSDQFMSKQMLQKLTLISEGCRSIQAKINSVPTLTVALGSVSSNLIVILNAIDHVQKTSARVVLQAQGANDTPSQFQVLFSHVGFTALMLAAELNRKAAFQILFPHEAGRRSGLGVTAMLLACKLNRVDLVRSVVVDHFQTHRNLVLAELEARMQPENTTALMLAAEENNRQVIEILLSNKEISDSLLLKRDSEGNTALHHAIRMNAVAACRLLAADEHSIRNNANKTPYEVASELGCAGCIEVLSEYGETGKRISHTPLMEAARNNSSSNCEEIIKLSENADLNRRRILKEVKKSKIFRDDLAPLPNVETMLHDTQFRVMRRLNVPSENATDAQTTCSSPRGRSKYRRQIGERCDCCHFTALMHAVVTDSADAGRLLAPYESRAFYRYPMPAIENDNETAEPDEYTALMIAVYCGKFDIARILIPFEAGLRSKKAGRTALAIAARMGCTSIVKELAELEGRIEDNFGDDCLISAIKYLKHIGDKYVLGSEKVDYDVRGEFSGICESSILTGATVSGVLFNGDEDTSTMMAQLIPKQRTTIDKILENLKTQVESTPAQAQSYNSQIIAYLAQHVPSKTHGTLELTHLQLAAKLKVTRVLEVLVKLEHGIRQTNAKRETALMLAAEANYVDGVRLLAPVEKTMLNSHNCNARMLAMKAGAFDAEMILAQYEDFQEHRLYQAIVDGNLEAVKQNFEFLGCMNNGESCLMAAAMLADEAIFDTLFEECVRRRGRAGVKTDFGLRDKNGYTCLMRLVDRFGTVAPETQQVFLSRIKRFFTVREEVGNVVQPPLATSPASARNLTDKFTGMTAFLMSCALDNHAVVRLFLEAVGTNGMDNSDLFEREVKSASPDGDVALLVVIKNGLLDTFQELVNSAAYVCNALPPTTNIMHVLVNRNCVEMFNIAMPTLYKLNPRVYNVERTEKYLVSTHKAARFGREDLENDQPSSKKEDDDPQPSIDAEDSILKSD
ncbi:Ankyrin repeat protein 1 [Giardia muris]|uniref:Ankyrin repeat protein 1 n=1 Tax=Giardia muris TaxID=5742 RepID=A0A4Z1SRS3_GIAMU|nr:Ankyrin repeat protein 1 [Giardia muris]|eukprot:TNJ28624.1 Ankyrin repeat protein 1 [Giardia muris]